jgi:hypothetical protein
MIMMPVKKQDFKKFNSDKKLAFSVSDISSFGKSVKTSSKYFQAYSIAKKESTDFRNNVFIWGCIENVLLSKIPFVILCT